jgi:hypothetical protein
MKPKLFSQNSFSLLHRAFARLHGGMPDEAFRTNVVRQESGDEFKSAYAEYASATLKASDLLQEYGAASPQFASADVASMRLFHCVKKMQGLRKSRTG